MNIGSYDSDSISTLFSSISSSSSSSSDSTSSIYSNLSELSSIKSGSYYKLVKKYYANEADSNSTSRSTAKELAQMETSSEELTEASGNLYKSRTLFKADSDGNYDMDKIYSAVSDFVDSYNAALKSSSSSEVTGIANAAASMVNLNNTNSSLLKQVGITMDSSTYKLSVDEDSLKNADVSTLKSLFSGTGSYAYQMGTQASMIHSYAEIEASKSNTYTGSGSYSDNFSSGSIYDSLT